MGGREENAAGNVIVSSVDNRGPFIMIPRSYSDGLSIVKEGPVITRAFSSERRFDCGRSFRTGAKFVSKLVPKRFVTTLTVDDHLTRYCECIAFQRRTVTKQYSETTNIFLPKEADASSYRSTLRFDPDATTLYYSASLEVLPARRASAVDECPDATDWVEKSVTNGEVHQQLNGEIL